MVLAVNIHFPFYIGVGAILLGIVILSTAHGLLTQAERVQAEQVAGATAPAGTEPASSEPADAMLEEAGPAAALIPIEGHAELAGPGASIIVAAVDGSPTTARPAGW
jgi:MFS transporter, ACDE family, multidrug resistance protein